MGTGYNKRYSFREHALSQDGSTCGYLASAQGRNIVLAMAARHSRARELRRALASGGLAQVGQTVRRTIISCLVKIGKKISPRAPAQGLTYGPRAHTQTQTRTTVHSYLKTPVPEHRTAPIIPHSSTLTCRRRSRAPRFMRLRRIHNHSSAV